MNQEAAETIGFSIRRQLPFSRERVWAAWTNPDALAIWHHPKGVVTPRETIFLDVREGGSYRYDMVNVETGQHYPTGGVYLEVRRPERLAFTWGDEGQSEKEAPVIIITLTERDGGTDLLLEAKGVAGHQGDGFIHDGWAEALDGLAEYGQSQNAAPST